MKIFAIAGRKQVGKDTFAKMAEEILDDKNVESFALAEPLKTFCMEYLALPYGSCFGSNEEKDEPVGLWGSYFSPHILDKYSKDEGDSISGREILQVVGTDIFRENFKSHIWIDICTRRIEKLRKAKGQHVIFITDVRFPNEYQAFKDLGATTIKLYRNTGLNDAIVHASETSLNAIPDTDYDHVIYEEENTNLRKLRSNVTKILNKEGLIDFGGVSV